MVVTGTLADEVGKNDATTVMNNSKMQVIKDNVQNVDDIYNIVINVAQENNVTLDSDQIDQIVNLLQQIAQQDYNYDDVKATLEQVNQNTSGSSDEIGEIAAEEDNTVEAGDSADGDDILNNVDNSVLGGDVVQSSTENPTLEQETGLVEDNAATDNTEEDSTDNTDDMEEVGEIDETDNWDETTDDSTMGTLDGEETTDDGTLDADSSDQNAEEVSNDGSDDTESYDGETTEELDTSSLTEDQMALFKQAENFCKGEYEGDTDALITAMEDETASASVTLDTENGATLSREVEKAYLKVLTDGTDSYQADGTEIYMSTELNMVDKSMKEIFGLSEGTQASPELSELSDDERQTLYNETMKFFEKLYGESSETYNAEDAENTESAE